MPKVGVRELQARASEIVRTLRERRISYIITYCGRPVGMLTPLVEPAQGVGDVGEGRDIDAWEELTRLGEEIGREWQSPLTGGELLSQMRR
jgi:antitoxin (DNA-binding transcriptional repressor) of toxin-antitoxin stability system